jgi:hypothetical protein
MDTPEQTLFILGEVQVIYRIGRSNAQMALSPALEQLKSLFFKKRRYPKNSCSISIAKTACNIGLSPTKLCLYVLCRCINDRVFTAHDRGIFADGVSGDSKNQRNGWLAKSQCAVIVGGQLTPKHLESG